MSGTFLVVLAMAINTPRCLDIQLPGGGKINNCVEGVPKTAQIDTGLGTQDMLARLNITVPTAPLMMFNLEGGGGGGGENMTVGGNMSGGNMSGSGEGRPVNLSELLNVEPVPISANYSLNTELIGKWNMTGTSNGYQLSAEIQFFPFGTYQISGKLLGLPNGNIQPFDYTGNYSADAMDQELILTSNTGVETTYKLSDIENTSFSASNGKTSEQYTFTRLD